LSLGLFLEAARAEDTASEGIPTPPLSAWQAKEIRSRIETLHARQADLHRKIAAGEITGNEDLRKQWPQIQEQLVSLHAVIDSLNALSAESAERPALEAKLLGGLQQIGIYLDTAAHPEFAPRILYAEQIAEMERIENAIAGMKFDDRESAVPVKLLSPDPSFTLIYLPVPMVLQCQPGESVFLAATTGGAFPNGLSLIELRADEQGIARTYWVSIGDAVGDCDITVYSQASIETQSIRIKVVSLSLAVPEGLPQPQHLKGEIPRLKSKLTTAKGRASLLIE